MEFITTLLEQQPLMALFLTIAIGYLVGEINIKGFSLGVGAVLFVALFMGWFAPKSVPAPMVGTLGLALFLYGVGVQYGKQFFLGLTTAKGQKANFIALVGVLLAGVVSILLVKLMQLNIGYGLGLFAGSGTSTPALQAAIATLGNDDPAVGYSVSYPFGVAGPIALLYIAFMVLKPRIEAPPAKGLELLEIALRNPELSGRTLGDVSAALPAGVQIAALRRAGRNEAASPNVVIAENDVVLAVGASKEALAQARRSLGEAADGRLLTDRSDLDYLRVFASRPGVVGRTLGDLDLPGGKAAVVVQVRRGDADIMPSSDLELEFGDRVGVLAHRDDFPAMRQYFGDSIKGTAEFSYISIGIGMALGFPGRRDPDSAPRHRQGRARAVGRADRGVDPRQPAAHRRHELDHSAVGQSRLAQPRADAVPGAGRDGVGSQVRRDGGGHRIRDAGSGRRRAAGPRPSHPDSRVVRVPDALRRGGRHRRRHLRQPGDPCLREQARTDGPRGYRLRDDLPRHDHRQNPLRGYRPGTDVNSAAAGDAAQTTGWLLR